jgi:hypothetical protein
VPDNLNAEGTTMRMVITGLVLLGLATPSLAAKVVYLKDGGAINAKSAWRSQGKVQVLINRDTLATFLPSEVDMKRTFPRRRHAADRHLHAAIPQKAAATPAETAAPQKASGKGISLPCLPSVPKQRPEMSPPSPGGKEEGTIRKQKREMQERLNENN